MKTFALISLLSSQTLISCVSATETVFKVSSVQAPFLEQFTDDWDSRWKSSAATKQAPEGFKLGENDDPETLFRYRGEWVVEKAQKNGIQGDKGLVAKTAAAHHAISVSFPKVVNPEDKDLVIQYELKLQDDLQCGGAYIKLLTDSKEGIKYQEFDDRTPYTIMFGPDKCGSTNKVHFIFRHQNPITKKWEEKHLSSAPSIRADTKTHLYTLIVHPDNTFEILIDQERVKNGNLLEDFSPSVNPPKEIDDPNDVKPEDWVDEPKIPDPNAVKPADWNEEAPRMVPDDDAEIPADWLEDENDTVDDPNAEKPEDWDDEEDGKWVAPRVPNPKCEKVSGCGKWTPPMKPNPEFKGKWYPNLVDNPAYKGPWEPKKISNPDYFEDLKPSKFTKMSGLGIEIWTMQAEIMFDNFYVGHSVADAKTLAEETFVLKKAVEEKEFAEAKKVAEEQAEKAQVAVEDFTSTLKAFFEALIADPVSAINKFPNTAALLALAFLAPTLLFLFFGRGGSKKTGEYEKRKKHDISVPDVEDEDEDADDEQEKEDKPRKTKSNDKQ